MSRIETIVRRCLCLTLKRPVDQVELLNLDEDLMYGFGLTSVDRIMLMTSVCADAGVQLTHFNEDDIGQLRTPSDIVMLLTSKVPA